MCRAVSVSQARYSYAGCDCNEPMRDTAAFGSRVVLAVPGSSVCPRSVLLSWIIPSSPAWVPVFIPLTSGYRAGSCCSLAALDLFQAPHRHVTESQASGPLAWGVHGGVGGMKNMLLVLEQSQPPALRAFLPPRHPPGGTW